MITHRMFSHGKYLGVKLGGKSNDGVSSNQFGRILSALVILASSTSLLAEDSLAERVARIEKAVSSYSLTSDAPASSALEVTWNNGLNIKDPNNPNFKIKIGGRLYNDYSFFTQNDRSKRAYGNWQNSTEFRAARFVIAGKIHENIRFKANYDFAGQDADFKDVFMEYTGNKNFVIRVGHAFEPFGIEGQASSKFLPFMERALTFAMVPGRNTGVTLYKNFDGKRGNWAAGLYRDVGDSGNTADDGDFGFTGRGSYAFKYENDGKRVCHVGTSFSLRKPNDRMVRYSSRPEAHDVPTRVVDTGGIMADLVVLWGLDALANFGPLSIQGEFNMTSIKRDGPGKDLDFTSGYAMASYFLTGERRPYKNGQLGRIKPKKNMGKDGWGAWEMLVRWSMIDLQDEDVLGGELDYNVTLGTNWYLNPNSRIMVNFINSNLDAGNAQTTMMRFQIDF